MNFRFPTERIPKLAEFERLIETLTIDIDRIRVRSQSLSVGSIAESQSTYRGKKIGFAQTTTAWEVLKGWYPDAEFVDDLNLNIESINECSLVFCGCAAACGDTIKTLGIQNLPAVEAWIRAGGRLFIGSEHNGVYSSQIVRVGCAQDIGYCNDWLLSIGSSMRNAGFSQIGPHYQDFNYPGNPLDSHRGSAAVAAWGIPSPTYAHGIITGGTSIRISTDPFQHPPALQNFAATGLAPPFGVCSIEKIGDGFLILCGDSNWFTRTDSAGNPIHQEIELFQKFWSAAPANLI